MLKSAFVRCTLANNHLQRLSLCWQPEWEIAPSSARNRSEVLSMKCSTGKAPPGDGDHYQQRPLIKAGQNLWRPQMVSESEWVKKKLQSLSQAQFPVAIFTNGIGDTLMSLPALRALASLYPDRLTLLCDRESGPHFYSSLRLGALVPLPTRRNREESQWWKREIDIDAVLSPGVECDAFFSFNGGVSESQRTLLATLRPSVSMGFTHDFDLVVSPRSDLHHCDDLFQIPRALRSSLCLEAFSHPPPLEAVEDRVTGELARALPQASRVLAVHPETHPAKSWSLSSFSTVLQAFLEQHPEFVAIVVGRTELPPLIGQPGERLLSFTNLPLPLSCALVSRADLFFGIDSCMLHVADFSRVPGLALFGPASNPAKWGYRFGIHHHLSAGSMNDLAPDGVLTALKAVWDRARPQSSGHESKNFHHPGQGFERVWQFAREIQQSHREVRPSPPPPAQVVPRRVDRVVLRTEGEQSFLIDPRLETRFVLNPTSQLIWSLCSGASNVREMAAELENDFDQVRGSLISDVYNAVLILAHRGLLTLTIHRPTPTASNQEKEM